MIFAGLALAGTVGIFPPAAQVIPSVTSDIYPSPHASNALTGTTLAAGATPAIPMPLLVNAAAMPATCVPCHEALQVSVATPGSLPVAPRLESVKAYPGTIFE